MGTIIRILTPAVALGLLLWAGAAHAFELSGAVRPFAVVAQDLEEAGIPAVLTPADAVRYRRIFALQSMGRWSAAEALIAELDDDLLLGHVRFHKLMHPTAYRSSFAELAAWLESYADHPGARRIYRLALRRQSPDDTPPRRPPRASQLRGYGIDILDAGSTIGQSPAQRALAREIIGLVAAGRHESAFDRLQDGSHDFSPEDLAQLEGRIATGYNGDGDYWRAFAIAAAAGGSVEPGVSWVHLRAGLAALQLDLTYSALEHFRNAATAPGNDWETAAGAYWTAHVLRENGDDDDARAMLRVAAGYPRTLYGQLALEQLGEPEPMAWGAPPAVAASLRAPTLQLPAARRAVALLQAGRQYAAETEFRLVAGADHQVPDSELFALAHALDFPGVVLRLGSRFEPSDPARLTALYPVSDWIGSAANRIDRALVHAVVRKESAFNIRARSARGARGLMQVLPRIARSLTGDERLRGAGADRLYEPALNLRLGQQLLVDVLDHPDINGNLIGALVAYNAGIGKWLEWQDRIDAENPLLFIESIPVGETRWFVKRVLASFWMYRDRYQQRMPARTALSDGKWPRYVPLDAGFADSKGRFYVGS